MILSIVIPCFNENETLLKIVKKIILITLDGFKKEIIIVDDGSGLKTKSILKKIKKEYSWIKIVSHEENMGKSTALRTGLKLATGDVVLIQDADLEYNPEDYSVLLEPIVLGQVDVVYGSRFLNFKTGRFIDNRQYLINYLLTLFSNIFTRFKLTDMETCYKVFTREVLNSISDKLVSRRFGFEPEFTARISKNKLIRVKEVSVSYSPRSYKEGKHIKPIDGIKTIIQIVWFNLFT